MKRRSCCAASCLDAIAGAEDLLFKVEVEVDVGRRDKEVNHARLCPRRTCMESPRPVKDMPHLSDRQGHLTHARKHSTRPSQWAARYCPKAVTATKQPCVSHDLQGTSRSLLLEGKARLNTIKHPNQLAALRYASAPTPQSQPQCALHALRRALLRSSGPWTARLS
jgi:hypothetical protein